MGIWHIRYFIFILMHLLWCKTRICSWNVSVKGSLMLDDPFFGFISLCFGVYQPLFYLEEHASYLLVVDPLQCKLYYLKMIPSVLSCLLNSNLTYKFLCGWAMFPDYLSIFYDYGHMFYDYGHIPYLSGDGLIFFCFLLCVEPYGCCCGLNPKCTRREAHFLVWWRVTKSHTNI